MPGSVIAVTGLALGPVGSISQTDFPLISPRLVNIADTNPLNFGDPFVLNPNNTYSSVKQFLANAGVLLPSTPLGIAKDTVETNNYYPVQGGTNMPAGFYPGGVMANGLTRGTINVAINNGTPVGAGSPVYIRTAADGSVPLGIVGGFEAQADGTATGAAVGGNTGNGTISALTVGVFGIAGVYTAKFTDATHYTVSDPNGVVIGHGTTGVAFASNGVNFTITAGGTPFAANDSFTITVAATTVVIPNFVFKTGILSTDPATSQVTAQVTILERRVP